MNGHYKSFVELLFRHAENCGDKVAYSFLLPDNTYHSITYDYLLSRVLSLASILRSRIPYGQPAGLLYPTGADYIITFLACLYTGIVAVPLNPPRTIRSLSRIRSALQSSGARVVLSTAKLASQAKDQHDEWLQAFEWLATDDIPLDTNIKDKNGCMHSGIAFLQYTSGSIGNPKGVVVTHKNLLHNQEMIRQGFRSSASGAVAGWLPLHHDMGLIGNVLHTLYLGATCYLIAPDEFLRDPLQWLRMISDNRAQLSGGPNFAYELCVQAIRAQPGQNLDLSCWKVAFCGSEPVRAETVEKVPQAFQKFGLLSNAFYPCYELAEGTLFVSGKEQGSPTIIQNVKRSVLRDGIVKTVGVDESDRRRVVSCGHSRSGQRIAVVDSTNQCEVDEQFIGEIWVHGQSVSDGYWQNPEESQKTFGAYLSNGDGPFLRTGDIGFILEGNLYVTGRLSDIIIIRGANYYPHDIEYSVSTVHEAIATDGCLAFSVDDARSEELSLVCEIRRTFRKGYDFELIANNVCHAIAIEHGLSVHTLLFVKPFTILRTPSGKIRRLASKESFLSGEFESATLWSRIRSVSTGEKSPPISNNRDFVGEVNSCRTYEERVKLLTKCLRTELMRILQITNIDKFDDHRGFWEMGMDSLNAADLRSTMEVMFDKQIPSTVVFNNPDLEKLVDYVLTELLGHAAHKESPMEKTSFGVRDKNSVENLSEAQIEELLLRELKSSESEENQMN